jgi:hypothetical protein
MIIPKKMRRVMHVACTGTREYPYKILFRKPEAKTPLGRW